MINKVIIQGRLTKDVELRHTPNGTPVTSFTVAWSEKRGDSEQVLFLPCVAWRNTAEFVSKHFAKGQEIAVEGKLFSRKWQDKDGHNREGVELTADQIHFCGYKKERDSFDDLADRVNSFKEVNNDDGFLPF
jgi:single-strand DNA-binding protein